MGKLKSVTLGRNRYGYYKMMEMVAWTLAIRCILNFHDYLAVPVIVMCVGWFEILLIWMEKRDNDNATKQMSEDLARTNVDSFNRNRVDARLQSAHFNLGKIPDCVHVKNNLDHQESKCVYCNARLAFSSINEARAVLKEKDT